jgi:hypothetical protein
LLSNAIDIDLSNAIVRNMKRKNETLYQCRDCGALSDTEPVTSCEPDYADGPGGWGAISGSTEWSCYHCNSDAIDERAACTVCGEDVLFGEFDYCFQCAAVEVAKDPGEWAFHVSAIENRKLLTKFLTIVRSLRDAETV